MAKHYDVHTLYIKCDCASADQIRNAFNEALTTYQKNNKVRIDCRYRVNLLADREGNSFGLAFVFVTNPAVYHMLLGKNEDGSDRIEYMDDPTWKPPADNELANDCGWSSAAQSIDDSNLSWADLCDLEDELDRQREEEENRYICPQIAIELEPLMVLPPYKLTPEQIETKRQKIIQENEGKVDFDPDLVSVPEFAHFGVDRAMALPVDPKFMPYILKAQNVPEWVTKEDLKAQFSPYASDSRTLQERTVKGLRIEETYPFVSINDGRVAFIIFDASTHDAQFALHMMKKTVITKKLSDGKVVSVTLIFGHSYRTDRDSMSTITQQPRPVQRRDNSNAPRQDQIHITEKSRHPRDSVKRTAATAVPQHKSTPPKNNNNRFHLLNNNNS